jgi:hypothetical protein
MVDQQLNESEAPAGGSQKHYVIVVNGRHKTVASNELGFVEVVALAFDPVPSGENVIFDVTYRRAAPPKTEGSLLPGETVHIQAGTIFNVTFTDKS